MIPEIETLHDAALDRIELDPTAGVARLLLSNVRSGAGFGSASIYARDWLAIRGARLMPWGPSRPTWINESSLSPADLADAPPGAQPAILLKLELRTGDALELVAREFRFEHSPVPGAVDASAPTPIKLPDGS